MNSIISLSIVSVITLFSGLYNAKKLVVPVSVLGIILSIVLLVMGWNLNESPAYINNMLTFDNYAIAFSVLILAVTSLVMILNLDSAEHLDIPIAELVTLFLITVVGAILMVSFSNLVMLFLGIEILSICLYVLAGAKKRDFASNEAALKYFLMGAFATGFLLFGITLIYGASGSFNLQEINQYLSANKQPESIFYAGVILMLIGMCFKIAAAPFHFWAPDVYTGSPTVVTAFMSTVVKTAGVAAFLRLFSYCFINISDFWAMLLVGISATTMLIGNITAVVQISFKRTMAFSSIAHAGYFLLAIFALQKNSNSSVLLYAAAYSFASIMAFTGLMVVQSKTNSDSFESFNGLAKRNPLLAFCITVAMLSLAGIPPLAGFFAKFYVFSTAIAQNYIWIVVFAVINSCIGVYYYFKVIIAMYFRDAVDSDNIEIMPSQQIVLAVCLSLTILLGLLPGFLTGLI